MAADTPVPVWLMTAHGVAFSDIPERPGGRMPDFCIIGSAKCGTTSLDHYLSHHPQIFACRPKEPHYFSSPILLERGPQWYKGLFADAPAGSLCGEASTSYTRYPLVAGTAERMHAANPAMKLIYLVRNPVDRVEAETLQTLKYLKNVVGQDFRHMPLDEFLEMIEDPGSPYYSAIVETSKYDLQIREFERFFPTDQILILAQRDLRQDPETTMRKVHAFLGVDPETELAAVAEKRNVTSDFLSGSQRERATERLRDYPLYGVAKRLLPQGAKTWLLTKMRPAAPAESTRLSESLRHRLETQFAPHNAALEKRLNLPWTDW